MIAYKDYSDEQLVELLTQSDARAFEEIYLRYWKELLFFASNKIDDFEDSENIVQDIFVSIWKRRTAFGITSTLKSYLLTSVKYRIIKHFERSRFQRIYSEQLGHENDLLDNSTQEYLDFEHLRERLEQLIVELPKKSELIFRLNKQDGKTHKEIALLLNMTEKAVNTQLVRIKKTLRSKLDSYLSSILL
ncbi:RNA polymerase sigma factor [Pedobacter jeongneungensis]|uniref:RNA polymerase sigma factor n=1 Tax=Pedobacter jeongneungensis TaxID=947309 RepID=UPI000469A7EC|nr:sigma-70 family RNA polymerase sigma factor [Pedobacter jeongneungensis]